MTRGMHQTARLSLCVALFGAMGAVGCNSPTDTLHIVVAAGKQALPAGPVWVSLERDLRPESTYHLVCDEQPAILAQLDNEGRLWWWSPPVPAAETRRYRVKTCPSASAGSYVSLTETSEGVIRVTLDGKLFTAFNFTADLPKPFLYPVLGPTGDPVTRDYPMKENDLERADNRQDHHHHRSIWTAHGDVRTKDFDKVGNNFWNDALHKGDDPQKVKRILRMLGGPVFGQVEAEIEWLNDLGQRELSENRTYTFFCGDEHSRIVDVQVLFKFTDADVMFADTKEGGIVAIRTAVTIDEVGGGIMCNSEGAVGEQDCWGKPADWCDYVGKVNGKTVGVAVFDAPGNFRHPTPWHIRAYGLIAANPFGISHFSNDKTRNGAKTWRKGQTARFDYRILIHQGDTASARVADHYRMYADRTASVGKQGY